MRPVVLRHLLVLILLWAPSAWAAPDGEVSGEVPAANKAMEEADKAFRFQDYDRAIVLLKSLQETS